MGLSVPLVVTVAKAGVLVGSRARLNLIEGSNVTLTVADDPANNEIDVTIAASGGSATFCGARAKSAADQAAPGGGASLTIIFGAEDFDSDGFHDNATNPERLTVPAGKDGKYSIKGGIKSTYGGVGGNFGLEIHVNGSRVACSSSYWAASIGSSVSTDYDLAVGDIVTLVLVDHTAGGNTIKADAATFLSLVKVS